MVAHEIGAPKRQPERAAPKDALCLGEAVFVHHLEIGLDGLLDLGGFSTPSPLRRPRMNNVARNYI